MAEQADESALFVDTMRWQFRMSWSLARDVHLPRLTDEICLWLPRRDSITVRPRNGSWRGDWVEPGEGEPWSVSAAWLTWHLQLWMTQALAEAAQTDVPAPHDVAWPGTAEGVVAELDRLTSGWSRVLDSVTPADLDRPTTYPWPDERPLHRLLAWASMEMMKNAAELGAAVNAALLAQRAAQDG